MERLWSGWRAAYVTDAPSRNDEDESGGSVFTELLASGLPDEATFIIHRGDSIFVIVNIHPYTSGHLLVLPYREVADLADLTPDETKELWATVTKAVAVIRREYSPHGLNVGLNLGQSAGGSVPTHLHVHVVPRWAGDSNFMAAIANTQTLPEAIDATAARLRAAWTAEG